MSFLLDPLSTLLRLAYDDILAISFFSLKNLIASEIGFLILSLNLNVPMA